MLLVIVKSYHDNYNYSHTTLGIHKTVCSKNLLSGRPFCEESSHLICGAYRLTVFFFRSENVY